MMREREHLLTMLASGRIRWTSERRAWRADPVAIVQALREDGYQEYQSMDARGRPGRESAGGMWQGLDARTGKVASAIWVRPEDSGQPLIFVDVDGEPLTLPY